MKICIGCREPKPLTSFRVQEHGKGGGDYQRRKALKETR